MDGAKKCIKSSFYCLKSSLLIVPRERRSWKHTTAHNFPPHMFNIKKNQLKWHTAHQKTLYIFFIQFESFLLTFFSSGQKRRRWRKRKMKTQQNFRVKMEMMGGRGRKVQTNEKEHVGQERKDSSENIVGSSKSK